MALLLSVWGKGGVGKSTVAAGLALLARRRYDRVLLVSTDPTPSVSLLLCGSQRATRCRGIEVRELSEEDVKRLWVERFGEEVYEVVSAFLPVDRWIIDYVAGAPGIADQFMLYYVDELVRSNGYDVVVWDTVAAGASLRLLRLEKEFYTHMGDAAKLYLRVRSTLDRLRRSRSGRDPLGLIESWRKLAERILVTLASPMHRAVVVAEPSALAIAVTKSIVSELGLHGIEPRLLVANKVMEENPCPGCSVLEDAVEWSRRLVSALSELGRPVALVPFIPGDPGSRVEKVAEVLSEEVEKVSLLEP